MPKKVWNQIEVTDRIFVPFDWRDPDIGPESLGRAEFQICLKINNGGISEFWVYPIQMHMNDCWHWQGWYDDFCFSSYQGLDKTGPWRVTWCEKHETPSLNVYAPPHAKFFEISFSGLVFWASNPHDK